MKRHLGMNIIRGVLLGLSLGAAACAGHTARDGAYGATTAATPVPAPAPPPNREMQGVPPVAALQPDAFDAPAAVSVAEAERAAQGGGHEGHAARGITPGQDRENPPSSTPATHERTTPHAAHADHSQHGGAKAAPTKAAKPAAASVYTCPMHPEVTSAKPGNCPKCGMTLVKKK